MELNWLESTTEDSLQPSKITQTAAAKASQSAGPAQKTKLKTWFLPVLLGLAATFCQFLLLQGTGSKVIGTFNETSVFVSKKRLERGTQFKPEAFEKVRVQDSDLASVFVTEKDLEQFKGRRLLLTIQKGEPLSKAFLHTDFQQKSAAERIPPGKRLFVLKANLGEFAQVIKPDDHIDLVASLEIPGVGESTNTILENVILVGVGGADDTSNAKPGQNSISFYVTPKEAEFLTFAKSRAEFSVILRNPEDQQKSRAASGMTINKFLEAPQVRSVREGDLFSIVRGKKN